MRLIVERHADGLTRTVAVLLGPVAEVDDVVQEVFLAFFDTLDRYRGDAPLAVYLKRIAVNRALDALRRRKRRRARFTDSEEVAGLSAPKTDPLEHAERDALVRRAVAALPPKQRAVVVLRMIEGHSTEETARMLGVPYGTVLSRLSRALDKLKGLLGAHLNAGL